MGPGLWLNPVGAAGIRAAYYSAAFILKAVSAGRLDIDPDELDISNVRQVDTEDGSKVGEIIIGDHLPNGAGFTDWISGNWQEVLASTTDSNADPKSFVGSMLGAAHQVKCDSSCYSCLRNYRNMAYHSLLDWRLGVSLLRALQSDKFDCGLGGDFSLSDLAGWVEQATKLRDLFCSSFAAQPRDFGPIPGLVIGNRQVLVVHPLWDAANGSVGRWYGGLHWREPPDARYVQPIAPTCMGLPGIGKANLEAQRGLTFSESASTRVEAVKENIQVAIYVLAAGR